jgi:hypothetical protein
MNPADYSALEVALEIMALIGTTRRFRNQRPADYE